MGDEVPVSPPPPEPPPKCMPEITFTSASKVLKELRTNPSTYYLGYQSLSIGLQSFKNENHACDYDMCTNNLLSSITTYDDSSPLLFRDDSKYDLDNMHPLTYQ